MSEPDRKRDQDSPEFHPDAWQRFERAIDVVVKSPPQHRANAKPKRAKGKKKRKGA